MTLTRTPLALALVLLTTIATLGFAQNQQTSNKDTVTVPAGDRITVRTDQAINTKDTHEGQTYPATVTRAVEDHKGEVLIPRGSRAELVVRQVAEAGNTGTSRLVLDLDSVTVNGHRYRVSAQDIAQSGKEGIGKNRRTGEMVGGGAVLGTLVGAIAGGGKGAAVGALAGGAAGGGAQVLTRGKEVKVPAETALTFQLQKPLHLVSRG